MENKVIETQKRLLSKGKKFLRKASFLLNKLIERFCLKLNILITNELNDFYFLVKLLIGFGMVLGFFWDSIFCILLELH